MLKYCTPENKVNTLWIKARICSIKLYELDFVRFRNANFLPNI
jgi:hypothetical protein